MASYIPWFGRDHKANKLQIVVLVIIGFALQSQSLHASGYGFTDRMNTARALLAASKRINAGSTMLGIEKAESILDEAQAAREQGDADKAREKLDQAYLMLKSGIQQSVDRKRTIRPVAPVTSKVEVGKTHRRLYKNLNVSMQALLKAGDRIIEESGDSDSELRSIRIAMDNSQRLYDAKQYDLAYETLHLAYKHLQGLISSQRDGMTVVRKLEFANAEEEFLYEIERNNTYKLLVSFLVKQRRENSGLEKQAQVSMAAAAKLRLRANKSAKNGDYKAAADLMEQSSRSLVKTIRLSGVNIPL